MLAEPNPIQESFCFNSLDFAKQGFLLGGLPRCPLAGIDKSKGVPFAVRDQELAKLTIPSLFQEAANALGELGKCRMFPNAAEPILGVPVIRLATVHYGVNKSAISSVDVLRYYMRTLEMIMP